MKFKFDAFQQILAAPQYEGVDSYLIDEDKNNLDYHLYLCVVLSQEVCALICKKLPVESNNYEVYEFNGNKLLANHVVRLKEVDINCPKAQRLIYQFENKEFNFQ